MSWQSDILRHTYSIIPFYCHGGELHDLSDKVHTVFMLKFGHDGFANFFISQLKDLNLHAIKCRIPA